MRKPRLLYSAVHAPHVARAAALLVLVKPQSSHVERIRLVQSFELLGLRGRRWFQFKSSHNLRS